MYYFTKYIGQVHHKPTNRSGKFKWKLNSVFSEYEYLYLYKIICEHLKYNDILFQKFLFIITFRLEIEKLEWICKRPALSVEFSISPADLFRFQNFRPFSACSSIIKFFSITEKYIKLFLKYKLGSLCSIQCKQFNLRNNIIVYKFIT